ncbi:hypothetical protein [Streptomyces sp. MAR4 CNX-425]|uniref:hypothetical protein n=1 Tax=Streptomyces sp. MAR4 CNX-425 TaxID=3406343 RepID=UPI003B5013CD
MPVASARATRPEEVAEALVGLTLGRARAAPAEAGAVEVPLDEGVGYALPGDPGAEGRLAAHGLVVGFPAPPARELAA